jgi:hypothetical protein
LHVHMRPRPFAREEVEPVSADPKNRGAHAELSETGWSVADEDRPAASPICPAASTERRTLTLISPSFMLMPDKQSPSWWRLSGVSGPRYRVSVTSQRPTVGINWFTGSHFESAVMIVVPPNALALCGSRGT